MQNHWPMKYRSHRPTISMRSFKVATQTLTRDVMQIHEIVIEILNKAIEPWNIGHDDGFILQPI